MQPKPETIKKALTSLKRTENIQYFFENLSKPDWIGPLAKEGIFAKPTPIERIGNTISFKPWPQSQYLVRMAKIDPKLVAETILKIPETENVYIHLDFINAALAMDVPEMKLITKKEIQYFKKQKSIFFIQESKFGELMCHLLNKAEKNLALQIAEIVLEVLPSTKEKAERYYLLPKTKIDLFDYEQFLKKQLPKLVEGYPIPAFKMLLRFLDDSIAYTEINRPPVRPDDYSYIMRHAIEYEESGSNTDVRNPLISAVRDSGERICKRNGNEIRELIKMLKAKRNKTQKPWLVNQRIALHLLRMFPSTSKRLVEKELLSYSNYDCLDTWHEFALLLKDNFKGVSEQGKNKIYAWIEKGPRLNKKQVKDWDSNHIEQYKRRWTLIKMTPISEFLSDKLKKIYQALLKEFGDSPDYYYSSPRGRSFMGPTSPFEGEKLKSLSVTELIKTLKTWKSSGEWIGTSEIGLGRELEIIITDNPEKYVSSIKEFKELEENPTYIRSILAGLKGALKKGKPIDWEKILEFMNWVVKHDRKPEDHEIETISAFDKDPHWGWTRSEITDLLSEGFNQKDDSNLGISFEFKDRVESVLFPITDDPDPLPEKELKLLEGNNMSPLDLSINSTRGKAIQTIIRFALWLKRKSTKPSQDEGLKELENVIVILDKHLNVKNDPSLAIRAVYGQWLPWLVSLNRDWAISSKSKIFPEDKELTKFREAAWKSYIVFNQPYDDIFEVFNGEYHFRVSEIKKSQNLHNSSFNSQARLGEHLISFYCRDKLRLEDKESLLVKYYENSSDSYCAGLGSYIGRSLYDSNEKYDPIVLEKIKKLWDWRMEVSKSNPKMHIEELKTFGWWYSSERLENAWAINNLKNIMGSVGKIDAYLHVLETLDKHAVEFPEETIDCLISFAEKSPEDLPRHAWSRNIQTTVQTIRSGSNQTAKNKLNIFIDKIGALKIMEVEDLLT